MKNIRNYTPSKYNEERYQKVEENIYKVFKNTNQEEIYVTSIMFEPEPELGENKPSDKLISQYPLEDILDKFWCWCEDFYEEENAKDLNNSYQEFASKEIEDIRNLRTIIGKHVYNKEENGYVKLIIE